MANPFIISFNLGTSSTVNIGEAELNAKGITAGTSGPPPTCDLYVESPAGSGTYVNLDGSTVSFACDGTGDFDSGDVILIYSDDDGNIVDAAGPLYVQIDLVDTDAPVVGVGTCPANISDFTSMGTDVVTGDCQADIEFTKPDLSDNCGIDTIIITYTAGAPAPSMLPDNDTITTPLDIATFDGAMMMTETFFGSSSAATGVTNVSIVAIDGSGNSSVACTFSVTIDDDEDPTWDDPTTVITNNLTSNLTISGFGTWDDLTSSGSINIVLDCNHPDYAADFAYLASFVPDASDNCDTSVTVTLDNTLSTTFDPCITRVGINNVYARTSYFFTAEDNGSNTLDHDVLGNDADGDDERFRLRVFTADPDSPELDPDSMGVDAPVALSSGSSAPTYLGEDVVIYADASCTADITTDTLLLIGTDCQDISYEVTLLSSEDQFGNPTSPFGPAPVGPIASSLANGVDFNVEFGGPYDIGTYTIEYTATDPCGNASTFTFDLVVQDTVAPTIADCPMDTIMAVANQGLCETTVGFKVPTATDCSGITSVTATATDAGGNPITIITGNTPGGTCVDVANFSGSYVPGNWTTVTTDGSTTNNGSTLTLEAPTGFLQTTTYSTTVLDTGVIEFTYDGVLAFLPPFANFDFFGYSVNGSPVVLSFSGGVLGFVAGTVQVPVNAGDTFEFFISNDFNFNQGIVVFNNFSFSCAQGAYADFPVGVSTVEYIATDGVGNMDTCTFFVKVVDTQVPTLVSAAADQDLFMDEIDCGPPASAVPDYASMFSGNFTDNCAVDSIVQIPAAGDLLPLSNPVIHNDTFSVVLLAYSAGLITSDTFLVTLVDNVVPTVATCPNDTILYTAASTCTALYNYTSPTFDDNCEGTGLAATDSMGIPAGNLFPLGITTVTHTYTDSNSNSASCIFTVEVRDSIKPVFDAINTIANVTAMTSDDGTGDCSAVVTFNDPTAAQVSDNCTAYANLTFSFSPASGSSFSVGTTLVTVTATDESGNSESTTFNVIVTDDEAPEIFNCPGSFVITSVCDTIPVPQFTNNVTDNCGIDTVYQVPAAGTTLANVPGITPANGESFVVKQFVVDAAGNMDSCETTVTLLDQNKPVPTMTLVDTFYSCGTLVLDAPTATTCDGQTIFGNTPFGNSLPGNQFSFDPGFDRVVIWTYLNTVNGETTSQQQRITVTEDTTMPSLACQADVTVNTLSNTCDTSMVDGIALTEVNIYAFSGMAGTFADTCGIDSVSYALSGETTVARKQGLNAGIETFELGVTTVTYYVTDLSGNTNQCTLTVTVNDVTAPTILTSPADTTVNCDAVPAMGMITASDNCTIPANLSITTSADTVAGSCDGNYVITRKWVVEDESSNKDSVEQVVTVQDTTKPVLASVIIDNVSQSLSATAVDTFKFDNDFNTCGRSISIRINSSNVSDNCTAAANISLGTADVSGVYPVGETSVFFTITDECGNATTREIVIVVRDIDEPLLSCTDRTFNLPSNGPRILTPNILAIASDNCPGAVMLEMSKDTFDCADIGPNLVTITATDAAGNTAICTATVTIQESFAPTAVCKPFTAYLDASGSVTVVADSLNGGSTDNCPGGLSYLVDNLPTQSYNCTDVGTFVVTLTVTDMAGNSSTCQSSLTIVDTISPTVALQNIDVYLDASGMATIDSNAVDNGSADACGLMSIISTPTSFDCSDLGPNTVDVVVTDVNSNSSMGSAIATVIDTVSPTIVCQNVNLTLDPDSTTRIAASLFDGGSTDACGIMSYQINGSDSLDLDCANFGTTTYTLTVTDTSGNSSTCMADLTLVPTNPVIFTAGRAEGPAGSVVEVPITVANFRRVNSFQMTVSVANSGIGELLDLVTTGVVGPTTVSAVTGNSQSISWNSNVVGSMNWNDLEDGDTAFVARIRLVGAADDSTMVNLGGSLLAPQVTQGCNTVVVTSLSLNNPGWAVITSGSSASISGTITRSYGSSSGVENVTVTASGDYSGTTTTDASGFYEFTNIPAGSNVTITPSKDTRPKNGVASNDAAAIRLHAVSPTGFIPGPYQILAGDVDGITVGVQPNSNDANLIQDLLANRVSNFVEGSWTFVASDFMFTDNDFPLDDAPIPGDSTVTAAMGTNVVDFEAMKEGDVTGDAATDAANSLIGGVSEDRTEGLTLQLIDEVVVAGETYTLNLTASNFNELMAMQMTLKFDTDVMTFEAVNTPNLSNVTVGDKEIAEGYLALIWSSANLTTLATDEVVAQLVFKAKRNADGLEDVLSLNDHIIEPKAYDGALKGGAIELELLKVTSNDELDANTFSLFQNRPNPFRGLTTISFNLPKNSEAKLSILDITGKVVFTVQETFTKGYNEVNVNEGTLPASGVYYYQLETDEYQAIRKMTLID